MLHPATLHCGSVGSVAGTRRITAAPSSQREQLDLMRNLNGQHLAQRGGTDSALEARIGSMEMAFQMQTEAQDVFNLEQESPATRDLYGRGPFANACLAARRLGERGVRKVHFIDGRVPHALLQEIFTDAGLGTEVVR